VQRNSQDIDSRIEALANRLSHLPNLNRCSLAAVLPAESLLATQKVPQENRAFKHEVQEKVFEIKRWMHTVGVEILPHSLYDKAWLVRAIQRLEDAVLNSRASIGHAKRNINESMDGVLSLIKSIPASPTLTALPPEFMQKPVPRTAFILM
jgi:hypothetical protein